MNEKIENLKKRYKIGPKGIKIYTPGQVKNFIAQAAIDNADIMPIGSLGDVCNTCGSKDLAHPETSYCFTCDTDNW